MIRAATTYWPPTEALLPVAIRAIYRPDGNWQTYQPEKLMRPGSTPGVGTSGAMRALQGAYRVLAGAATSTED